MESENCTREVPNALHRRNNTNRRASGRSRRERLFALLRRSRRVSPGWFGPCERPTQTRYCSKHYFSNTAYSLAGSPLRQSLLWTSRRFSGDASEAAPTQPPKNEYGSGEGDCAYVHSRLSPPGQTWPEDVDVEEASGVVHKEGAKNCKQRTQYSQQNGPQGLFPPIVLSLMVFHRNHAVIHQDGIGWIQRAVRPAIHSQGFQVNRYVRIATGSETVVVSRLMRWRNAGAITIAHYYRVRANGCLDFPEQQVIGSAARGSDQDGDTATGQKQGVPHAHVLHHIVLCDRKSTYAALWRTAARARWRRSLPVGYLDRKDISVRRFWWPAYALFWRVFVWWLAEAMDWIGRARCLLARQIRRIDVLCVGR